MKEQSQLIKKCVLQALYKEKNENILNAFVNIQFKRKHCEGEFQSTFRNRTTNIFFLDLSRTSDLLCEACVVDNADEDNMGTQ